MKEEEEDKSSFCEEMELEFLNTDNSSCENNNKDLISPDKSTISDDISILLPDKSPVSCDIDLTSPNRSPNDINLNSNINSIPSSSIENNNMLQLNNRTIPTVSPINISKNMLDRPPLYKCMTLPSFYHSNNWWKKDQVIGSVKSNDRILDTINERIDIHQNYGDNKIIYSATPGNNIMGQRRIYRRVKSICLGIHNYNQDKMNMGYKTYISKLKSYLLKQSLRVHNPINIPTTPLNRRRSSVKIDKFFSSSFKESISEFYTPDLIQESLNQKELLNHIDDFKINFNWDTHNYVRSCSYAEIMENKKHFEGLPYESISQMLDELESSSDFISFINNINISINNIKKIKYSKNTFLTKSLIFELEQIMDIVKLLYKQNYPESNLINNESIKYSTHIINNEIQNIIEKILDDSEDENLNSLEDNVSLFDTNSLNENLTDKQISDDPNNVINPKITFMNQNNNNVSENTVQDSEKYFLEKKQNEIIEYTNILKHNNNIIENMDKFKCGQQLSRAPLPVNSFSNLWPSIE